ncbi:hypothetical protein [Persicirhabdus sediminis]|uniref:WD40-like Beta Propeller Repeat n=1 Tax=Persicirhabdus sediminis TaxID=454144 RepID=A0A8J7MDD2_9BACT|nr:hypothetical protein [Persicirhabdus sediminis]MBK1791007.1 hypothetical protein [Persicirhabdus sediminis]
MRLATLFVILLSAPTSHSQTLSPNKSFAVEYRKAGASESDVDFIRTSDKKVLYQAFSSGVGGQGYEEIVWSPDSRYLAVTTRGTKTTVSLEIYRFEAGGVTQVKIPDYRLNLLGRHNLVSGGRYSFARQITWTGSTLTFSSEGSLLDGVSNPRDSPENWYRYQIKLDIYGGSAELSKVVDLK